MGIKRLFKNIYYFFPFQLLLEHFKRNQIILLFWIILFGFTLRTIGDKYGIYSLFLAPEYLDKIDFWSFFILGFVLGSFIIAYNISSYIVNAHRFPFIATLSKPFIKFSLNNFIIPIIFIVTYITKSIDFQKNYEFLTTTEISYNILGFILGVILFIFLAFSYFFTINKDIFETLRISRDLFKKGSIVRPIIDSIIKKEKEWKKQNAPRDNIGLWRIETYISPSLKIKRARNFSHYTSDMIQKVLRQNNMNSAFFAIGIIIVILVLGIFMENPIFMIPAGASIMLFFTLFILVLSAIHSFLREWSLVFFIALILLVNSVSNSSFIDYRNNAYGLNYDKKIALNIDSLNANNEDIYNKDYQNTIKILNNWKNKNYNKRDKQLPKIILINTSGGGQKLAIWTYYSLSFADSVLKGQLLKQTQLITGASGGMVGASYLRELYLRKEIGLIDNYYNDTLLSNFSKDMLNPIAFSLSLRDWAFNYQKFNYNDKLYNKDRAFEFEQKLNKNTNYVFSKKLSDYRMPEQESIIPMMIFTPTIINDGRKLLISPQDISYLINNSFDDTKKSYRPSNIEFRRVYKDFDADNLLFTSAIRMNATFPYVSPIVSLPGEPRLNIMDAGLRDNYGLSTSLKFLYIFKEWISKNTSGVIIIQIAEEKVSTYKPSNKSALNEFIRPLGNVYKNLFNIQDINNKQQIIFFENWINENVEFLNLNLSAKDQKISLSWHLNKKEKLTIKNSIHSSENQKAISRLKEILEN